MVLDVLESCTRDGHHVGCHATPLYFEALKTAIYFETCPNSQKLSKIAILTVALGVELQYGIGIEIFEVSLADCECNGFRGTNATRGVADILF